MDIHNSPTTHYALKICELNGLDSMIAEPLFSTKDQTMALTNGQHGGRQYPGNDSVRLEQGWPPRGENGTKP
jgi:hypothetical protein